MRMLQIRDPGLSHSGPCSLYPICIIDIVSEAKGRHPAKEVKVVMDKKGTEEQAVRPTNC